MCVLCIRGSMEIVAFIHEINIDRNNDQSHVTNDRLTLSLKVGNKGCREGWRAVFSKRKTVFLFSSFVFYHEHWLEVSIDYFKNAIFHHHHSSWKCKQVQRRNFFVKACQMREKESDV